MASTKATIRTQVTRLLGDNTAITNTILNDLLEADHLEILETWQWSRRKTWTLINTTAPVTLDIGVTQDSPTVTGAGFTAAMGGRLIRIGSSPSFYQIKAVTPGVDCTLGDGEGTTVNYPEASLASTTARIWQHIYSVASNAELVTGVYHNVALREIDPWFFDHLDPERITEGDPPEAWGHFGRASGDVLQIVLFPLPSAARTLRVTYLKVATLATDSDTPMYRPDLLKFKTAEHGAARLLGQTGDEAWARLADLFHKRFEDALKSAKEDDLAKSSSPTRISPVVPGVLQSDEFALSHDVWTPTS